MKILKHGTDYKGRDTVPLFKCGRCQCEWWAERREADAVDNPYNLTTDYKMVDYKMVCPECGVYVTMCGFIDRPERQEVIFRF